jgi:hypothetical protein
MACRGKGKPFLAIREGISCPSHAGAAGVVCNE